MSSPAMTRKRSRAYLEEDELSPEKDKTTTPLSGTKKRKLNTNGSSPGSETIIGGIKGRIRGLLSWGGKGKENAKVDEDADELANEGNEGAEKDIWAVPHDDETRGSTGRTRRNGSERTSAVSTPNRKQTPVKPTSSRKANETTTPIKDGPSTDIWEVPDEEISSTRRSGRRGASSFERVKATLAPVEQEGNPAKRSPGRPKKAQILKEDKKLSKIAKRERLIAAQDTDSDEESIATPMKHRKTVERDCSAEESLQRSGGTSSRRRGRPRKTSVDTIDSTQQVPKGILTPRKNRTLKSRKSVAFQEDNEVDLGFKDLPGSASAKKLERASKLRQEVVVEIPAANGSRASGLEEPDDVPENELAQEDDVEPEDEGDDEVCVVCSKPDFTTKNQILFCDGCDLGYHQACCNVLKLPKKNEDWFCTNCQPAPESNVMFDQLDDAVGRKTSNNLPDIEGFGDHLRHMQRSLLDKLTSQKRVKLRGHDEEMQKVYQVVEQTILAGEGNSMLVIGARGSGKTTLVESVISELSADHRESFHVVRLNGFIHTDDKLALKEIWRQLGREMEVEDDLTGKTNNYADTLASLLALLSHPSEISESQPEQTATSVVFILDEFDLFTTHSRQTLLYNLFDIAQARKAPIVVLGLTARIDVVESLEKRVKSRFSHRYVHLSLPRSLPTFWDICKEGLLIDAEELRSEGFDGAAGQDEFLSYWKDMIEDLYKDAVFKNYLESHFYRTKSVAEFFASCILPIANLSSRNLPLTSKSFTSNTLSLSAPDSKLQLLPGLSELELALLIAAARLDIILDTDTCNFAMAYDEYSSLTSRHKIQTSSTGLAALGASAKIWGREVALGAWEKLADYELIVPTVIGGGSGKDFGVGGRMWKVDVGLEEITGSVDDISGVMAKWCREI